MNVDTVAHLHHRETVATEDLAHHLVIEEIALQIMTDTDHLDAVLALAVLLALPRHQQQQRLNPVSKR